MPRSHENDAALERSIAELAKNPKYLGLLPCRLRFIAEFKAINRTMALLQKLSHEQRWEEIAHWRGLRTRGFSECKILSLVEAALHRSDRPLSYITQANPNSLAALEEGAAEYFRNQRIIELVRKRQEIDDEIDQLTTKKAA